MTSVITDERIDSYTGNGPINSLISLAYVIVAISVDMKQVYMAKRCPGSRARSSHGPGLVTGQE